MDLEYIQAYKTEQAGGGIGSFGMKIDIASTARKLDAEDGRIIQEYADKLKEELMARTLAKSEKAQEAAAAEREQLIGMFAGTTPIYVQAIPNGYCSRYCCRHLPWFKVTTSRGVITVGWRKSVIQIEWSESEIKDRANVIFEDQDVTKGDRMIHAWGTEKGREYIDKLLAN